MTDGTIQQTRLEDIGILGGMFDPVHHGHLSTALAVLQKLELDEVRLLPAGDPPHRKAPEASIADRTAMLELAVAGERGLRVDTRECERSGPSYMVETLASLRDDFPDSRLFLILGDDAFNGLPDWHHWRDVFQLAHVVVVERPGWELAGNSELRELHSQAKAASIQDMKQSRYGGILHCTFMPLMISSSAIRRLIREGCSVRYLLPDAVIEYIHSHLLYRNRG